ncbi:MAG: hypothetical protein QE487_08400 [Fluviicola sp.]|nr:hypothetical protein [Fluviicola sp.]
MKLKSTFLAIAFFATANQITIAQEVEWSELVKSNGRGTVIYPEQGKNFYTTVWSGGMLAGNYQLKRYEDFMPIAQEKIVLKTESGVGSLNDMIIVNGKMVIFLSDKADKQNKLYYQLYTESCTPVGIPTLLAEYEMPKGWNKSGYFNVIQSKNKAFFCVEYSIPSTKTESERFGYKVYNNEFNVVSEGEYESPYDPKEADITNHYLSNTGDLFLGLKVYNTNDRGKVRDYTSLKKYLIFLIKDNDMTEMNLDLGDKRITDMTFSSDERRILTCTGLYGEGSASTKGAFYFQVDFANQEIVNEGFSEFTKDFITQDWSEKQKTKANKREEKGKGAPQLYSYDFREVHTTADGGVIVVMEQYYVIVHTTRDARTGATTTTYTYYYNDIITYRVQEGGQFEWIQKMNKRQVSTNDGGYYSSIGGYFTDDKFIMFFNDNTKNYTETGDFFLGEKGLYAASYRKKTNCVAKVEIDLTNGEYSRNRYTSREETAAYAVPKKFTADYINSELFMYFQYGKKEKFGLLKF